MVETKGPPDTKYGRTVCRRAVSESLHRRFVYPTSEKQKERERRSERERGKRRGRTTIEMIETRRGESESEKSEAPS